MLQSLNVECTLVQTPSGLINQIRTPSGKPPLLLVHGWGGALGFWRNNIAGLAENYTVYAIDGLGWGLSSRPTFEGTGDEAVTFWVQAIEEWVEAVGLQAFTLVGHSLGGYICGRYALAHPERVTRLVLAAAAGIVEDNRKEHPMLQAIAKVEKSMGSSLPLSVLRRCDAIGAGPWLLRRLYGEAVTPEEIEYILACAALPQSGEVATLGLNEHTAPLWGDLGKLEMPTDLIYGELDNTIPPKLEDDVEGPQAVFALLRHPGKLLVIKGASHSCYDAVHEFNRAVVCC